MGFDAAQVFSIVLRSAAVYLFIIFAIRLFGKKELAQLSVVDLVFILLISNAVQTAMVGADTSLPGGIAAATGLFTINYIFKFLIRKFPSFGRVVQGHELMLVYHGKIQTDNLEKSMLTREELEEAVREHGVEKVSDVDLAILEVDGNISVMSKGFSHKTSRKKTAHKSVSKNF